MQLDDIAEDLEDLSAKTRLTGVADRLTNVITDVRTYIQGLRARQLDGRLLADAMVALVHEANGRGGTSASCVVEGDLYRLPDAQANTLLHLAREALANVAKHAHAAWVWVRLTYDQPGVTLTVADNGRGFDPEVPQDFTHHGLRNLRTRTEEAGGTLTVQSSPGAGISITAFLPTRR